MLDKRKAQSIESVINLRNFLKCICDSPKDYCSDKLLRESLKSQGALAKYSNSEKGITASSLNTLKRISAEYVDGGFNVLDNIRKGALERIEELDLRERKSNKRTRLGLAQRVNELEANNTTLEKVNYLLLQAVTDAIGDIKSVANIEDQAVRTRRAQEAVRKLLAIMSIKAMDISPRTVPPNVIHLNQRP